MVKTNKKTSTAKTKNVVKKTANKTVSQAAKKTVATVKVTPKTNPIIEPSITANPQIKMQAWNKKLMRLSIVIVVLAGAAYLLKNVLFVAMVNGQPISRFQVISKLEKSQGASVLENLVNETLIKQAIKKEKVVVAQEEIDNYLKEIEENVKSQNQELDKLLEMQGMTREELISQIEMQKAIEKIISKNITISEEDVKNFLTENKEFLPEDQTEEELNTLAKQQLNQQKLSEAYSKWLEDLKAAGSIKYFREY